MKILFCCEFYAPSVGGVQEVMRQLAERLVEKGHQVTVATSKLSDRNFDNLNGVQIREFAVTGNLVRGIFGDDDSYRDYVVNSNFDVVMIKAAQQWTFDALWPVVDIIKMPKVFIPCGFSGLYEPEYAEYFRSMPEILSKFDHLIFYASKYRDIDFARQHNLSNFSIIPNGASEIEFEVIPDHTFRQRHEIAQDSFVFMTVGSFTGLKGHLELVKSFCLMVLPRGTHATLILNGNDCSHTHITRAKLLGRFYGVIKTYGWCYAFKHGLKRSLWKIGIKVGTKTPQEIAIRANRHYKDRRVIVSNFARPELVQAYMATDLFVFASNVEYSPLVLFESAAAGIPFLTVDVGNSVEIANWTQSGQICPSEKDEKGYTRVSHKILAGEMAKMMSNVPRLREMGNRGKHNWSKSFTWHKITTQYEQVFESLLEK